LYLELANGQVARIANVPMIGEQTIDHSFQLGKLPSPAKTISIDYNEDVLSDN
jgi:hypothetical protein